MTPSKCTQKEVLVISIWKLLLLFLLLTNCTTCAVWLLQLNHMTSLKWLHCGWTKNHRTVAKRVISKRIDDGALGSSQKQTAEAATEANCEVFCLLFAFQPTWLVPRQGPVISQQPPILSGCCACESGNQSCHTSQSVIKVLCAIDQSLIVINRPLICVSRLKSSSSSSSSLASPSDLSDCTVHSQQHQQQLCWLPCKHSQKCFSASSLMKSAAAASVASLLMHRIWVHQQIASTEDWLFTHFKTATDCLADRRWLSASNPQQHNGTANFLAPSQSSASSTAEAEETLYSLATLWTHCQFSSLSADFMHLPSSPLLAAEK